MLSNDSQIAGVYNDYSGLNNLRREAGANNKDAQNEVGQQFEALFVQMMLKSMRAASGKGIMDSAQTEMARDMYDQQLAVHLSKQGAIGIGDLVMRQVNAESEMQENFSDVQQDLQKQLQFSQYDGTRLPVQPIKKTAIQSVLPRAEVVAAAPAPEKVPEYNWEEITNTDAITFAIQQARPATPRYDKPVDSRSWTSPKAFVDSLTPAAQEAANRLGTEPEAVLAIAALETGWGKHIGKDSTGASGNNLFGIKADKRWQGEQTRSSTLEFENGVMQRKKEPFRTYHSPAESVADFASFILENPRYQEALAVAGDPERFVEEIHKAGYATDPAYSNKVKSVMGKVQQISQESWLVADNRS